MTSIIKVQDIQNATGDNIIKEASNTITIGASGDTTNIVGTLQNNGAGVGGANTPAFHAFLNTNQTGISDNTYTKVSMNTELFDSDGCYDHSSNYRFTPTTAGKYFVYFNWSIYSATANSGYVFNGAIYKNGSNVRYSANNVNSSYPEYERTSTITSILDMNGSSDYVEAYVRLNVSSGDVTASGNATGSLNYFGAYKIIT